MSSMVEDCNTFGDYKELPRTELVVIRFALEELPLLLPLVSKEPINYTEIFSKEKQKAVGTYLHPLFKFFLVEVWHKTNESVRIEVIFRLSVVAMPGQKTQVYVNGYTATTLTRAELLQTDLFTLDFIPVK